MFKTEYLSNEINQVRYIFLTLSNLAAVTMYFDATYV